MKWLLIVLVTNGWTTQGDYSMESQQFRTERGCLSAKAAFKSVSASFLKTKASCHKIEEFK